MATTGTLRTSAKLRTLRQVLMMAGQWEIALRNLGEGGGVEIMYEMWIQWKVQININF